MAGDIFIARQGAVIFLDGQTQYITPGQTARAGHRVLASYGHLFAPLTVDFEVSEEPAKPAAKPQAAAEVPEQQEGQPAAPKAAPQAAGPARGSAQARKGR
jgi:hypothetical protein